MIRGVLFTVQEDNGFVLRDIVRMMNLSDVVWQALDVESYFDDYTNGLPEPLFDTEMILTNSSLLEHLQRKHYLIFVDMKSFPKYITPYEVKTYEEFRTSECEAVVLIADSITVEIYMKDLQKLHVFYQEATSKFENVEYITDENDMRYRLSI